MLNLGMTRAQRIPSLRVVRLQLVHGHGLVAGEMQEHVLEEAGVAIGEDEAVAVEEAGAVWRVSHHVLPESDSNGRHADGAAGCLSEGMDKQFRRGYIPRMSAIELLTQICHQKADGLQNQRSLGIDVVMRCRIVIPVYELLDRTVSEVRTLCSLYRVRHFERRKE